MFKYRRFFQGAIAFLTAVLVIACNAPNPSDSQGNLTEEIPLGLAVAQTSNVALFGQEQILGGQIAEAYFNDNGGVNGKPIKIITQDVAADEQGAINAFNTLINQNQVVGIVGPTLSQQAFAANPIAERAQVPVLGPSNTAEGIPQIGEFTGRVSAPVSVVAPNALAYALTLNPDLQRVAVLYAQNDAYSNSETEIFQAAARDLNLEIVTVQRFQTTDTDFQAQATAAINAQPDLVIISGLAADAGNLVKQLRELGYGGLIVGGNGLNTSNIFPVCQAQCDGVLVAQAYSADLDNDINRAFREAYFEKNQKDPPQFSAQAFTAIQVFVEALRSLDAKTPLDTLSLADLRRQLRDEIFAGTYTTPLGDISFTAEGDIIQQQFFVAQIEMDESGQQGRFAFIPTN
ncbi:ABC transporter substrate-binding protein [Picosynechococcus sp. NKBG15041c]|uniref:ABC transporter substrate-binding protein n=1 Tax=Picosynechococcus sp. NKBG15041c TaxID=1407650 RepID=UPI0004055528|nr:ABC transporter substrate-binding protein [Picosynechococcus sp. NKBG15041c]